MFLDFYRLHQQPFGVTPDPAYLYPTRTHREALESLTAGIRDGRGFLALVAEPGMGKTTLLMELLEQLKDSARTVFLFQTQCDSRELFQYLLSELGADTRGLGVVGMHNKLNEILFAEMLAARRFVLVIDEAQNLAEPVLETVRLLSDFETSHTKLLQIVLAGQPQLAEKLASPRLAQLRQRVAVLTHLEPLSPQETGCYIDHRLSVAGHLGCPLFTREAAALVAHLTGGIPRSINNLCYQALELGRAAGCETITPDIVKSAQAKLTLRGFAATGTLAAAAPAAAPAVCAPAAPRKAAPGLSYKPMAQYPVAARAVRTAALITGLAVLGFWLSPMIVRVIESTGATAASLPRTKRAAPARAAAPSPAPERNAGPAGDETITTASPAPNFAVQAAVLDDKAQAEQRALQLSERYHQPVLTAPIRVGSRTSYRVRILVDTESKAEALARRLRNEENVSAWVIAPDGLER